MTLQQLRYFFGVARWKSFTAAAEGMYVSQPALSKQIAQLEKQLGFALFDRSPGGVKLTEKGQVFYDKMHPLYHEMTRVLDELSEPAELRVGALPSIGTCLLPEIAASLLPVRLHTVNLHTTAELLEHVERGDLDAAFVQDQAEYPGLHSLLVMEEPYLVAMPAQHQLAAHDEITMEQLMRESLVMHRSPCDIHDALLADFARMGCEPQIAMKAPHESILGYTATGTGLSFIPEMSTQFVTHKDIVYRPITGTPLHRKISVFARSGKVLDLFREHAKRA